MDSPPRRGSAVWQRWRTAARRAGLFRTGERVGVAVSGGMDSMLLLDFMLQYAHEIGLKLAVVHFNHHLRAAESGADERFVREQAERLDLDFIVSGADVARVARQRKRNLEATARHLRYGFFFSLLRQRRLDKIVTGHTANDQAETVLLRLFRGTGSRGLGGIRPALGTGAVSVLRPFLDLSRAEIEAETARRGLAFRADSSNQDPRFRRNRIRRELLPLLEREFNPQIVSTLAGFADRARDDEDVLEALARERALPFLVRENGGLKIPGARLAEFPPALARRVLRRMVLETAGASGATEIAATPPVSISHADIAALMRLTGEGQSGKRLLLPGGIEARREFEWLTVRRAAEVLRAGAGEGGFRYAIAPPSAVEIPPLRLRLRFTMGEMEGANRPQPGYTTAEAVWLRADGPGAVLTLRSWSPGDRVRAAGGEKQVKLKDYFQRRRVPMRERPYWPVLELAGEIIWARGVGPAAGFERGDACRVRLNIQEERAEPLAPSRRKA